MQFRRLQEVSYLLLTMLLYESNRLIEEVSNIVKCVVNPNKTDTKSPKLAKESRRRKKCTNIKNYQQNLTKNVCGLIKFAKINMHVHKSPLEKTSFLLCCA